MQFPIFYTKDLSDILKRSERIARWAGERNHTMTTFLASIFSDKSCLPMRIFAENKWSTETIRRALLDIIRMEAQQADKLPGGYDFSFPEGCSGNLKVATEKTLRKAQNEDWASINTLDLLISLLDFPHPIWFILHDSRVVSRQDIQQVLINKQKQHTGVLRNGPFTTSIKESLKPIASFQEALEAIDDRKFFNDSGTYLRCATYRVQVHFANAAKLAIRSRAASVTPEHLMRAMLEDWNSLFTDEQKALCPSKSELYQFIQENEADLAFESSFREIREILETSAKEWEGKAIRHSQPDQAPVLLVKIDEKIDALVEKVNKAFAEFTKRHADLLAPLSFLPKSEEFYQPAHTPDGERVLLPTQEMKAVMILNGALDRTESVSPLPAKECYKASGRLHRVCLRALQLAQKYSSKEEINHACLLFAYYQEHLFRARSLKLSIDERILTAKYDEFDGHTEPLPSGYLASIHLFPTTRILLDDELISTMQWTLKRALESAKIISTEAFAYAYLILRRGKEFQKVTGESLGQVKVMLEGEFRVETPQKNIASDGTVYIGLEPKLLQIFEKIGRESTSGGMLLVNEEDLFRTFCKLGIYDKFLKGLSKDRATIDELARGIPGPLSPKQIAARMWNNFRIEIDPSIYYFLSYEMRNAVDESLSMRIMFGQDRVPLSLLLFYITNPRTNDWLFNSLRSVGALELQEIAKIFDALFKEELERNSNYKVKGPVVTVTLEPEVVQLLRRAQAAAKKNGEICISSRHVIREMMRDQHLRATMKELFLLNEEQCTRLADICDRADTPKLELQSPTLPPYFLDFSLQYDLPQLGRGVSAFGLSSDQIFILRYISPSCFSSEALNLIKKAYHLSKTSSDEAFCVIHLVAALHSDILWKVDQEEGLLNIGEKRLDEYWHNFWRVEAAINKSLPLQSLPESYEGVEKFPSQRLFAVLVSACKLANRTISPRQIQVADLVRAIMQFSRDLNVVSKLSGVQDLLNRRDAEDKEIASGRNGRSDENQALIRSFLLGEKRMPAVLEMETIRELSEYTGITDREIAFSGLYPLLLGARKSAQVYNLGVFSAEHILAALLMGSAPSHENKLCSLLGIESVDPANAQLAKLRHDIAALQKELSAPYANAFGRITHEITLIVKSAYQQCALLGDTHLNIWHILLAIVDCEELAVKDFLHEHNFSYRRIREQLEEYSSALRSDLSSKFITTLAYLEESPSSMLKNETRKVDVETLEQLGRYAMLSSSDLFFNGLGTVLCVAKVLSLRQRLYHMGSEHLLYALLLTDKDSRAEKLLHEIFRGKQEKIRADLLQHIATKIPATELNATRARVRDEEFRIFLNLKRMAAAIEPNPTSESLTWHLLLAILTVDCKGKALSQQFDINYQQDVLRALRERAKNAQLLNSSEEYNHFADLNAIVNPETYERISARLSSKAKLDSTSVREILDNPDDDNTMEQYFQLLGEVTPEDLALLEESGILNEEIKSRAANSSRRRNRGRVNPNSSPSSNDAGNEGPSRESASTHGDDPVSESRDMKKLNLENFCVDLTRKARMQEFDPVYGRNREIERIVQILLRKKKNNPVLVGDAGVGKTAIVEGLAQRIAEGKISSLAEVRILSLDQGALVAGTRYRGDFEERVKVLINALSDNPNIILFIDEIHTILSTGDSMAGLNFANLLKPALARGTISCIGATTTDEYSKTIERDRALERRMQRVNIDEPTPEEAKKILFNLKESYENHHNVKYTDDAILACVNLSLPYLTDRTLPDKAIDAMDEAGAAVTVNVKKLNDLIQERILTQVREHKSDHPFYVSRKDMQEAGIARSIIERVLRKKEQIAITGSTRNVMEDQKKRICEKGMVVDEYVIAEVISSISKIPVHRMLSSETDRILDLEKVIMGRVIGQVSAVKTVAAALRRNKSGLRDPNRPIGTFLFLGATGIGKTHLAKQLALQLFNNEKSFIRLDMSEFSENYTVSRLLGSPPGYVGYGEGGQLSEPVRQNPYSVVLLDEIEKAHPSIFTVFLQMLDEGQLTDSMGRKINFRNTLIIMTSNVGSRELREFGNGIGFSTQHRIESMNEQKRNFISKRLEKTFPPELINRFDELVFFNDLNDNDLAEILQLEIDAIEKRTLELGHRLTISPAVALHILSLNQEKHYGARPLKRLLQSHVENIVADYILTHKVEKHERMIVDYDSEREVYLRVEQLEVPHLPEPNLEKEAADPDAQTKEEENKGSRENIEASTSNAEK